MFWLHGLWSRAAWWGLALLWIRVSLLENSDGGQCDNILLVFSLTGRHLLRGLPVLLCSWAWTLRVVDVLCCGASVWLRMREVILLLKLCAWRVRVQSSVLWRRSVLLIKGLLLIRLLKQPSQMKLSTRFKI